MSPHPQFAAGAFPTLSLVQSSGLFLLKGSSSSPVLPCAYFQWIIVSLLLYCRIFTLRYDKLLLFSLPVCTVAFKMLIQLMKYDSVHLSNICFILTDCSLCNGNHSFRNFLHVSPALTFCLLNSVHICEVRFQQWPSVQTLQHICVPTT